MDKIENKSSVVKTTEKEMDKDIKTLNLELEKLRSENKRLKQENNKLKCANETYSRFIGGW